MPTLSPHLGGRDLDQELHLAAGAMTPDIATVKSVPHSVQRDGAFRDGSPADLGGAAEVAGRPSSLVREPPNVMEAGVVEDQFCALDV